jgi:hypothetical protein
MNLMYNVCAWEGGWVYSKICMKGGEIKTRVYAGVT